MKAWTWERMARWLLVIAVSGWMGCSRMPANPTPSDSLPADGVSARVTMDEMRDLPSGETLNRTALEDNSARRAKETPLIHKVKWRRETLYVISQWYTGSGNNWPLLLAANPRIKPKRIRQGDSIHIPRNLLKTDQPMPAGFLSPATSSKAPAPPPAKTLPETKEEIAIFGPIDNSAPTVTGPDSDLPMPLETID